MVRTKFTVIENKIENDIAQIRLDVVTSSIGNTENSSFWEHTQPNSLKLVLNFMWISLKRANEYFCSRHSG
jgi:hypothetical protein